MVSHKFSGAVIALMLLSLPASSAYACGCGRGLFGSTAYYAPYSVGYAPYVASYAPAGCGQVVNYMPQTYYRTVYVNQPVMAYSPVTACNACGGATTVMRPVTTYVTAARLVPYTSYAPVVTSVAPAIPAAVAAPATTTYYAPAVPAAPVAPAAPACCGASYAPGASYSAPAATATYSTPAVPSTTYSTPGAPGSVVRSLGTPSASAPSTVTPVPMSPSAAPPSSAPQKTFEKPLSEPESRVVPPRDDATNSNTSGARRLDRDNLEDRTTAVPLRQAWAIRPASLRLDVKPAASDSGWRPAAD